MMGVTDEFLLAHSQGGNPIRIVPVQNPRETEELLPLSAGSDRLDDDVSHWKK